MAILLCKAYCLENLLFISLVLDCMVIDVGFEIIF